ncbi:MAG: AAA family ATPase, partial [Desulfovibrionaceae bacterium]|nr:AAA family ATPase [Desulfovibrionaceae bacterium]
MLKLPLSLNDFSKIITRKYLYVDKTDKLVDLIENGESYFCSGSSKSGKSLTCSTLVNMFKGKSELFLNLLARDWVLEVSKKPYAVFYLDLATLDYESSKSFEISLQKAMLGLAKEYKVEIEISSVKDSLMELFKSIYDLWGEVVVIIDNYDRPLLDCINNSKLLLEIRRILKSFYQILDSCNQYIRFIFITGQESYNRWGIFSTLKRIEDLSKNKEYIDLFGFTFEEIEKCLGDLIIKNAQELNIDESQYLDKIRAYANVYSLDSVTSLYHPKALMQCLKENNLENYLDYLEKNNKSIKKIYTCLNPGDEGFLKVREFNFYV